MFKELAPQYPGIDATHYYIDALAMYMVLDPGQFQVIVTNNLFGDIITDLGATFQGGLGMAASGNIHPGQDVDVRARSRIGAEVRGKEHREPDRRDCSAALMLETLGFTREAAAIDARPCVKAGHGRYGGARTRAGFIGGQYA